MDTARSSPLGAAKSEFSPVHSTEVLRPKFLPKVYSWMEPGQYAVYEGKQTWAWDPQQGAMAETDRTVNWGWEINYVKGGASQQPGIRRSQPLSKDDICLGYTLYLGAGGWGIDDMLRFGLIFICFFRVPVSMPDVPVKTPKGTLRCFNVERQKGAFNESMDYELDTTVLVRMAFRTLGNDPVYSCILSETNIPTLGLR